MKLEKERVWNRKGKNLVCLVVRCDKEKKSNGRRWCGIDVKGREQNWRGESKKQSEEREKRGKVSNLRDENGGETRKRSNGDEGEERDVGIKTK